MNHLQIIQLIFAVLEIGIFFLLLEPRNFPLKLSRVCVCVCAISTFSKMVAITTNFSTFTTVAWRASTLSLSPPFSRSLFRALPHRTPSLSSHHLPFVSLLSHISLCYSFYLSLTYTLVLTLTLLLPFFVLPHIAVIVRACSCFSLAIPLAPPTSFYHSESQSANFRKLHKHFYLRNAYI